LATVVAAALGLAAAHRAIVPPVNDGTWVAPALKLDPNTAPPQVLGALPQVGSTLVRQLILARQDQPFTSLEDLQDRVRGVGPATLEHIAPFLRLESAIGVGRVNGQATSRAGGRFKKPRTTARNRPRSPESDPRPAPAQLVARAVN
jgi:hypothetical protein